MSLYEISIPVFIRILENLSKMLEKTVSFINEKNIPPEKLLTARLAEDMPPFIKQI